MDGLRMRVGGGCWALLLSRTVCVGVMEKRVRDWDLLFVEVDLLDLMRAFARSGFEGVFGSKGANASRLTKSRSPEDDPDDEDDALDAPLVVSCFSSSSSSAVPDHTV